jgi:hypothetical protein
MGQAIIERREWSAFVLRDTIVCNGSGRFFLIREEMPGIETWGSINSDPWHFVPRVIRTCIIWTSHFVFFSAPF